MHLERDNIVPMKSLRAHSTQFNETISEIRFRLTKVKNWGKCGHHCPIHIIFLIIFIIIDSVIFVRFDVIVIYLLLLLPI